MIEQKLNKPADTNSIVPSQATFSVILSKLFKGDKPIIANAKCEFSYTWDFQKNMGLAQLVSIDGCIQNITLHPLGIQGYLDFMSDIPPTSVVINGQIVVLNRIILDINLATNERSAGIMFNSDGSCIQTTENFQTTENSKF